jgi:hypothetical protein
VEAPERLKACPYCSETVLASARKCRHCGEWLDGTTRVQTIEATGKRWKLFQLVAGLLLALAVVLCVAGVVAAKAGSDDMAEVFLAGGVCAFFGVVLNTIGRGGAWWYHG